MKINQTFAIREVAGEYILLPVGRSALAVGGMLTTNEVGAFICEALREEVSREELIRRLCEEFDAPREVIAADLDEFLDRLRKAKILQD